MDAITTYLRSRFSYDVLAKLDALIYFIPSLVIGPDRVDTSELYVQYKACLEEPAGELRFRGELDL